MTATGDHETAAATYARLAQWMLWILLPLVAVMSLAGGTILLIYGPAFSARRCLAWHRRSRQCYQLRLSHWRNGNHGPTAAFESSTFVDHMRSRWCRASLVDSTVRSNGAAFGILLPYIVQGILRYANAAMGVSLEKTRGAIFVRR